MRQNISRLISTCLIVGCVWGCGPETVVRPDLPPSATDLILLKSAALCGQKPDFLKKQLPVVPSAKPWGSGQELVVSATKSASHGEESYFFNEEGFLVGALFVFPAGLDLEPYSVLRHTLSLLKPSLEFYVNVSQLPARAAMDSSALYETGDEKTTTQYLVLDPQNNPVLLEASFSIDPYVRLFSPYRKEFLDRLKHPSGGMGGQKIESQGSEDKEPFPSLQQFARGEAAQLAYCGDENYDVAADAYQKAIASGISDKHRLADAHNKLGLAFFHKGEFQKAKSEMQQSLAIRPNYPPVLNNLGEVHVKLGEKAAALSLFEKAVVLKPNYATARYNLAQTSEETNPKRAISEYETFVALVTGIPEEEGRIAHAQERIKALKR